MTQKALFTSINGLATGAVTSGEVTTLAHELGNNSVKLASLIAKTLLTSAKGTEVLGGLGDNVSIQLERNATSRSASNVQIEENLRILAGHSTSGQSGSSSTSKGRAECESRTSEHDDQQENGFDNHQ